MMEKINKHYKEAVETCIDNLKLLNTSAIQSGIKKMKETLNEMKKAIISNENQSLTNFNFHFKSEIESKINEQKARYKQIRSDLNIGETFKFQHVNFYLELEQDQIKLKQMRVNHIDMNCISKQFKYKK